MGYNVSAIIGKRIENDFRWHYNIKRYQRFGAYDAWKYCKSILRPLNTLLRFHFEQNVDPSKDVEKIRAVTNYCRIAIKRMGIENYAMWSRHKSVGSTQENCMLLIHVPDECYNAFASQLKGWNIDEAMSDIEVSRVDYSQSMDFKGKQYSVFEVMMRNPDDVTKRLEPAACYEQSEPLYKPVLFYSIKVEKALKWGQPQGILIEG